VATRGSLSYSMSDRPRSDLSGNAERRERGADLPSDGLALIRESRLPIKAIGVFAVPFSVPSRTDALISLAGSAGYPGLENRYGLSVHRGFESPPLR
jgi:hypothetical protein